MSAAEHRAALERAARQFGDPAQRARYMDLYDEHVVLHGVPGVEPGIESVRRFYEVFWGAFPDARLTLHGLMAEGDRVACRFTVAGTHRGEFMGVPATGRAVAMDGITILRFAGGRCVERWSQADFAGLLQQLGAAGVAAEGAIA